MKYEVLTYGNRALRNKSKKVEAVDESIKTLALDMLETMYDAAGVGLAAEQIGRDEAIFVIDILPVHEDGEYKERFTEDAIKMPLVAINPEIKQRSGECTYKEGCLSFPGITVNVTRPKFVVFEYTNLDGQRQTIQAEGLLAEAIDHESDHLDGVLIVDRMSPVQKVMHKSKLKKLIRTNK